MPENKYVKRARLMAEAEALKAKEESEERRNKRVGRGKDTTLDGVPMGTTERDGKGRFVSTGLGDVARRESREKRKK